MKKRHTKNKFVILPIIEYKDYKIDGKYIVYSLYINFALLFISIFLESFIGDWLTKIILIFLSLNWIVLFVIPFIFKNYRLIGKITFYRDHILVNKKSVPLNSITKMILHYDNYSGETEVIHSGGLIPVSKNGLGNIFEIIFENDCEKYNVLIPSKASYQTIKRLFNQYYTKGIVKAFIYR